MKAIIIAGGLGTRLRPLTYNTPKPIVPLANRPLVAHQIELLHKHGINEVILNLHYLSDEIKRILEADEKLEVKLDYSIEKTPLGTAGAVKNAEEFFDEGPLVVFNGDVIADLNISEILAFHKKKKALVTITLTAVDDPTSYGLVLMDADQRVKEFIEKPSWERVEGVQRKNINAGLYILDPKIFRDVPANTPYMFERDLFPRLLLEGAPIYGYETSRYWIDIGNPQKYRQAHEAILRGEVPVRLYGRREAGGLWVGENAEIHKSVKLFGPALIGANVQIEENALIREYSVLGDRMRVGANAEIANSILWAGTTVGKGAKVKGCIIGFDCRIEEGAKLDGAILADRTIITKGTTMYA
ncbi:MAG: NDP-sugar synthase [Candidatus Margulisiibacteriota bacterium]